VKKLLSIVFVLIFLTTITSTSYADNIELTAEYAILMDYETGQVLYDKNSSKKLYPASTTKIWTAYVVLNNVKNLNEMVEVKDLPPIEGTSMYLRNGETFSVRDLLESLLVHSSNDVAYVLANYVGGSIEDFVKLMNEEAQKIGVKNTNFNNPHGLPDTNHYSTAYDMALMAREAMGNEIFREMVKLKYVTYPANEFYEHERIFLNSNKFLHSSKKITYKGEEIDIKYDIVDGIKTGYTDDAGNCLVSSAYKDGRRLICAVFKTKGSNIYVDSRTLLDYGFDNFKVTTIVDKFRESLNIKLSKQGKLTYEASEEYKIVTKNDDLVDNYKTEINLNDIKLPIQKGALVGTLNVYNNDILEKSIDLIATNNVESIFLSKYFLIFSILSLILIIFIIFLIRKILKK
jgi:D-alanyl-D-alanine carboxypeptidase (penicillin-binding protein 5/6)